MSCCGLAEHLDNFYPRPLRGGRQHRRLCVLYRRGFLSTPSARRATCPGGRSSLPDPISIHALCEEGDGPCYIEDDQTVTFLSTPSARRATRQWHGSKFTNNYFYPRPLRGGRHNRQDDRDPTVQISIHALCEEGDAKVSDVKSKDSGFLSTPSARRATWLADDFCRPCYISIHALCEEGDVAKVIN